MVMKLLVGLIASYLQTLPPISFHAETLFWLAGAVQRPFPGARLCEPQQIRISKRHQFSERVRLGAAAAGHRPALRYFPSARGATRPTRFFYF